jgi:hypothetical protein
MLGAVKVPRYGLYEGLHFRWRVLTQGLYSRRGGSLRLSAFSLKPYLRKLFFVDDIPGKGATLGLPNTWIVQRDAYPLCPIEGMADIRRNTALKANTAPV